MTDQAVAACDTCGRTTKSTAARGRLCRATLPDDTTCEGRMTAAVPAPPERPVVHAWEPPIGWAGHRLDRLEPASDHDLGGLVQRLAELGDLDDRADRADRAEPRDWRGEMSRRAFLGSRMAAVLRRLAEAEAQVERERQARKLAQEQAEHVRAYARTSGLGQGFL